MARFYLTTAIDYVNSRPHLGTAYEKICADVIARYKRLAGFETWFVMGNDEHSQNVYKSAVEQGLEPIAYCDRMEEIFKKTWRALDVSYDDFIRTTEPRHRSGVTELAKRIHDAGDIYEGVYEGWYCVGCEAFKPEKELVDGRCPLHPASEPQWIKEKNYFFRLSKYQPRLLDVFTATPGFVEPAIRRNEQQRLLESGLEDISISRAGQSWGIPLPWDPSSVIYVWFDALINYATAVGLGTDASRFAEWWPADLHVIGKDITRFHTVIWPAMLMSAGLPIPRKVFGHGFLSVDGQRMSKSLGTIVDPIEAANRHGVDPLRLYLTKEVAFGGDGDFSWDRFDERYNVDLANNLGNLVSRVAAMAHQYRQGRLTPAAASSNETLAGTARSAVADYRAAMDRHELHLGAAAAFRLVDATNEFIAAKAPWALAKDPVKADELSGVLYDATESIRLAAVLLSPFIPSGSAEILRRVGADASGLGLERDAVWRASGDRTLLQAPALWPRFERKVSKETGVTDHVPVQPLPQPPSPAEAPVAADNKISIDEFMKVELRTAKVVAAEAVPKSKKLLKLQVDLGTEQRTILAGIAESYEPASLVGRTIVVVANLKPAKLMGIESQGMVLAASPEGGRPVLLNLEADPGWRVR